MKLLVLLSLFLTWRSTQQVNICGSEYYDVNSLSKMTYWSFKTPCLKTGGPANCTIYFSVCQSAKGACPDSNAGVCMESNTTFYTLGNESQTLESNQSNGFIIKYPNGHRYDTCASTSTRILFTCNLDIQWNLDNPDVTPYVVTTNLNPLDCVVNILISYSGACIREEPVIPIICSLESYNINLLSAPKGWSAAVDKKYCVVTDSSHVDKTCNLLFSFCKKLPSGQCPNSVFCQDPNHNTSLSFGNFSTNNIISAINNNDDVGFTITNQAGSKTSQCPKGIRSTLTFVCNNTASWKNSSGYPIVNITRFITPQPNIKNCEYNVKFRYDGACPTFSPYPNASKVVSNVLGWIVLAIVCIVVLYVIVGVVVQAVRGKRGVDLIPNLALWKTFLIYIMEGCQFSLDVITCKFKKGLSASKVDYDKL